MNRRNFIKGAIGVAVAARCAPVTAAPAPPAFATRNTRFVLAEGMHVIPGGGSAITCYKLSALRPTGATDLRSREMPDGTN